MSNPKNKKHSNSSSGRHRLSAILFADIAGYTALMQANEHRALTSLQKFKDELEKRVPSHQGEIVQFYGDGCLAVFTSSIDAMACAMDLQQAFQSEPKVPVRVGIHAGDVVFKEDNVFGDAVNIASRIESMAIPGAVLLSSNVRNQIKNKPEFQLTSLGRFEFKNVKDAMTVYALANEGFAIPEVGQISGKLVLPSSSGKKLFGGFYRIPALIAIALAVLASIWYISNNGEAKLPDNSDKEKSIAVLPFKLIGNDEEGQYFADGIMDVLIGNLNEIEALQVRSRTSVERFTEPGLPVKEIGDQLNVLYLVEGSAQKYQDDIRIVVQLIDVATDDHLWEETYDRKFSDIFKVQSEIALKITNALNLLISDIDKKKIEAPPTSSKEAWDFYLRGRYYHRQYWKFTELADIDFAINFYEKALQEDPEFSVAMSFLAMALKDKHWVRLPENIPIQDSIFQLTTRAIELDASVDINQSILGDYYFFIRRDPKKAFEHYHKALDLNPTNQFNYAILSWRYLNIASLQTDKRILFDSALIYGKKGLELESSEIHNNLFQTIGQAYLNLGEFSLAEKYLNKALEMEPDDLWALHHLFHIKMFQGKYEAMMEIAQKSFTIKEDNKGLYFLGKAYLLLERYDEAEEAYRNFYALPKEKHAETSQERHAFAYVLRQNSKEKEALEQIEKARQWIVDRQEGEPYDLAKVYSFLGEKEKALEQLEKFIPWYGLHAWIDKDPLFENIRNEPRFKAVVNRCKVFADSLNQAVQQNIAIGLFPTADMIE